MASNPEATPATPEATAAGPGSSTARGAERRIATKGRKRQRQPVQLPTDESIRIVTRRLSKRYETVVAVDNLDLEVRAGEIFGLLGQNGAGKTTTILMLLGLTEPTAGVARVAGFDPARRPLEVKRSVGYLPDNVGFYDGMTGRQNLRYTARLNGLSGRDAEVRIGEALEQVRMTDRADTRTDTYSRGMLQRLGIADALVKDPSVLILDEPTTAIDPIGVVEILDLLRSLVRERGLAVLLSSHLLAQVQSVCDRVGIFAAGKLIGVGTVPELAERFGDGTARIEVGFEGLELATLEGTAKVLRAVDGVVDVQPPSRTSDPFVVLARPQGAAPAVREAILALASSNGLRLSSIREEQASLEEIYRDAVRSRAKAAQAEAAA